MLELKRGAEIQTADGDKIGQIDRVVIDPRTKEVTHLVVRKGGLFSEDRVLPAGFIQTASEDQLTLSAEDINLEDLPLFEEEHYVLNDDRDLPDTIHDQTLSSFYWYPPLSLTYPACTLPATGPGVTTRSYMDNPGTLHIEKNIPEGTVAMNAGAKVYASDGEVVGSVERVFTDPRSDQATHLLISKGLLVKERKLVPAWWIEHIKTDEIHLAVSTKVLEHIQPYEE
jgi:uncharacterized protein YrrD